MLSKGSQSRLDQKLKATKQSKAIKSFDSLFFKTLSLVCSTMKFALFAMALTLFVSAFGQFCEAVPDTSLDGNAARLLRKKSSPEPKKTTKPPFQHLSLQKVDVSFQGDLDGEPTGEELDFFNDCFMVSYDEVFGDSGYQIDFAALSDAPVRRERRGLRCSQNWSK